MAISRRQFIQLVGGSTAAAAFLAACRPRFFARKMTIQSPAQLPEDLVSGIDNWYATACNQCASGCGVLVRVIEGRAKKVEGNPLSPINQGRLCVRGQSGVQAVYHPDRIRRPMKANGRGSGNFTEITWDEALKLLGDNLKSSAGATTLITDSINGHLGGLVGAYAAATNATWVQYEPIEDATLRAAINKAFGQTMLPDFDIANSGYVLCFGADFLGGWISQVRHSKAYGHFRQGAGRTRGTLVQVDSRFSQTAANAEEWLPVKPGSEGKLAFSLAQVIISENLGDAAAANALTGGRGAAALAGFAPERMAEATGLEAERIRKLARDFASKSHGQALAIGGGSAGAHTNGVSSLAAIYSLNYLVGAVGKAGGVIFNPTPALTGGLFSDTLPYAGKGAVSFDGWRQQVERLRGGQVKTLLVRNADPVHGSPAALDVEGALAKVPFIASFSSFLDDTTWHADLVLPTNLPLEEWGDQQPVAGPGYQAITFQQPVIRPFQDSRSFGDLLLALAQEQGAGAKLPWTSMREVLRDGAQKLLQLKRGSVSGATLEHYWENLVQQGGWKDERARAAATPTPPALDLSNVEAELSAGDYPFALVPFETVSLGDGRNAHLPWMQAVPDPITTATWTTWVEVNAKWATENKLKEGDLVRLESPAGSIEAAVYPHPAAPPGVLAIPLGQGHKAYGRWASGRGANPLKIVETRTDRQSGALAWAATRVRMTPTGGWRRVPKMEGVVVPRDATGEVVQISKG